MLERVCRVLEYDKMKEQLLQYAGSSLGKKKVKAMTPLFELERIKEEQDRTAEAAKIVRLKGNVPLGGLKDIRASIKRAEIGAQLNERELLDVASTIYVSRRFRSFVEGMLEDEIELSILPELILTMTPLTDLEHEIKQAIDENGHVMDSASHELRQIRQQIRSLESAVRSKLENTTRSANGRKMLSDAIITIRNDRYVLPVKAEYRGHFGGIVHDQSASGQTLFIEPEFAVTTNNQLREAKAREENEIQRILFTLSNQVGEYTQDLGIIVDVMTEVDFMFAKAFYGASINASEPRLDGDGRIDFRRARHPLIPDDEIVPIDVSLGNDFTSLVITGPNTGGKTVTLKTVGMLTLMAQSGLQIPAQEGSTAGIYQQIFADIGDEQSIEQSLSTFSSHMTNIVSIMNQVNHESLVLFDELGAGTDPTEGAALAIAILDRVKDVGANVIATTHYSELKGYAYNRDGVVNASVEFDVETLRPTYRLLIGVPGRSNAFAISRRLGLSDEIIEEAGLHVTADSNKMEKMISSLEDSRKAAESDYDQADALLKEAEAMHEELRLELEKIEREKERIYEKAEEKANKAVEKAKEEAEFIIAELREMQDNAPSIKDHKLIDAKKRLEDTELSIAKKKTKQAPVKKKKTVDKLIPGDEVKVLSLNQKGYIAETAGKSDYMVQLGMMKMKVSKDDLLYIDRPKPVETKPLTAVRGRDAHVKTELDLRGERYESAMMDVEKYLDDAVLAGYHQVSIIHGKGTGALRKGVQELLERHPNVKSTRMGTQGEGGNGVTIAMLK